VKRYMILALAAAVTCGLFVSGAVAAPVDGTGAIYGVYGECTATTAYGYLGYLRFGVFARTPETDGIALYGIASSTTGDTKGVYGRVASNAGTAVYALATSTTGTTRGVDAQCASDAAIGVYGYAYSATGATKGVYGRVASTSGTALHGIAAAATGTTYGVYARVVSNTGWAGYFQGGRGIHTPGFQMPTGATNGYVLTCNATGVASWQPAAGGAASDHGTLTGLTDDDHPQYHNDARGDARYWKLMGNAGTTAGTHFLGTTDDVPLQLHVNGTRALRIEPQTYCPNWIGGYSGNTVTAGVYAATIGGGGGPADMPGDTVPGTPRPNRVTDRFGTIGGGVFNVAGNNDVTIDNAESATVSGGYDNTASGDSSTVGGGSENTASGDSSTVGGGSENTASGDASTVGAGNKNTASGDASSVGGGGENTASGWYSTLAGGYKNVASGDSAAIGGGYENAASGWYSTVGGGQSNAVTDDFATVSGGEDNSAGAKYATVGGGTGNSASGWNSTLAGGEDNDASGYSATVGGGRENSASNDYSVVGGGYRNTASGWYSTVGGGHTSTASGHYSFAAGRRARAGNQGAFVWADSTDADYVSTAADQFRARVSGGVYFHTNAGASAGVYVAAGGGSWASVCDRNAKQGFVPVQPKDVLDKLVATPISTWSYKTETGVTHMSPMAQDLHAAFGLGDSDRTITTIDGLGISMAAIQGLYQLVEEKDAEIGQLKDAAAAKDSRITELEQRLSAVEAALDALGK